MEREIYHTTLFNRLISSLLKKRQILQEDFNDFKEELAKNPDIGDVIPGTSGVRKARLKSASRGKRGGSRVCYYDITEENSIYLLFIYAKNQQENLTSEEKKLLKDIVTEIRRTLK